MNKELKNKLGRFPFIDNEELNAVNFNVIQMKDGMLNLIIEYSYIDTEQEEYPLEYGITMRTSVYTNSLVDMANHVQQYLDLNLFDYIIFLSEGSCFDTEAEVLYEYDWEDYFTETPTLN